MLDDVDDADARRWAPVHDAGAAPDRLRAVAAVLECLVIRVCRNDLVVGGPNEVQTARMEFQLLPVRPPFAAGP